ncbi:MAG: NAD(P)-dependent oxidoreductase [Verrucomicrobiota bacterium]
MKIVVLDTATSNISESEWSNLLSPFGKTVLYRRLEKDPSITIQRSAEADIIVTTNQVPFSREIFLHLPKLRLISLISTGYNAIDLQAASEYGVTVTNVPAYSTESVAQHTMALILELCHQVTKNNELIRQNLWKQDPKQTHSQAFVWELTKRVIGIIGFGNIGRRVAKLAHAFGMEVWGATRHHDQKPSYVTWKTEEEIFASADVVSLHRRLDKAYEGFVNSRLLRLMKPTAFLINTARGKLINETDLIEALNQKTIAGAALDVVAEEPAGTEHPLLHAPNCFITPHMAWNSQRSIKQLLHIVTENIRAFLEGKPQNVVNLPVASAEILTGV